MSYQPTTIANLLDGETGYQLDTNDYIAVSKRSSRACDPNHIGITMKARWVDAQGKAQVDHGGSPVEWEHTYSALQSGIAAGNPTPADFLQGALDRVIQGGATGATPDQMHPDGGIRARIQAVKALLTVMS